MFTRLSFLTLALVGVAGIAHAQYTNNAPRTQAMPAGGNDRYQAMMGDDATYPVAITDEYGFRYNARGDRLNARGHIIPPPVTPPGARALK
jgi:hypothetical protein